MSSLRHRFESFGGILAVEDPPMLVHVDRDFMRSLGHQGCSAWDEPETGLLSAPLEVHLPPGCAGQFAAAHPGQQ